MISRTALLISLSFILPSPGFTAEPEWADNPPRIDVSADRSRSVRTQGGDWDDKEDRMRMKVTIRNEDLNNPVEGLKGEFWLITRSAVNRSIYQIEQRETFEFSLTAKPEGREFVYDTPEVLLKFDKTGAVFGTKYHGWILVIWNKDDEIVGFKASSSSYKRMLEEALALKPDDWVDSQLRPSPSP
ncbi:MAG: hypothetical protein WA771_08200 [Chthoniobacterales bacterium]